MKLSYALLAHAVLASASVVERNDDGGCHADNCARAVTGTRQGPAFQATARKDCSSFLAATVTATVTPSTKIVTVTVTAAPKVKRADGSKTVPAYASACSGSSRYSSACSCFGIRPSTTTVLATASQTLTSTKTVTVTAPTPSCSGANLLTDPNNCGKCGTKCPSGKCVNGACSAVGCSGKTCSTFGPCGPGGSCVCGSTTDATGFCVDGSTPCSGLPACTKSADCAKGGVCAVNTCCGRNVCIAADRCTTSTTAVVPRELTARDWVNGTIASLGTWMD